MSETKKILVVDDEEDIVQFLSVLLEDNGYEVVVARNGIEALEKARADAPALISLDITMPEQSGVKAYKELRNDDDLKSIPIVIVTGYEDPNFEKFIKTRRTIEPPDAFFEKPIQKDEFLAKVKDLTG
ncbi:response regulator [bacterium]|nr:response regulator [bacterium]